MIEAIQNLQSVDWGTWMGGLAILIVAIPKIKKYLEDFESESGFVFPWTTKQRQLDKRFEDLDAKITKVDNRITTTRKEVEDKFSAIHENEHAEHEVWHQQSISIRDNLAANQARFEQNQEQFMKNLGEISATLSDIKSDLLDERLERKRWNILNCASKLRNNEFVDMEEYNNVFQDYDSYEDLIKRNGKTNGLIEVSIKLIKEKYQETFCCDK